MKFNSRSLLTLAVFAVSSSAYAGSAVLSLAVSGTISALPNWVVDGTSMATGSTIVYNFNPVGSSLTTINSTAHTLLLANPTSSTSLSLVLPSGCTVGSVAVGANFLQAGTALPAGDQTSAIFTAFTTGSGSSTAVQLTGVNNNVGTVACTSVGSLTYSF